MDAGSLFTIMMGSLDGDACPSLKRHLKLHEVSRAKILENKRRRLNSSPQPGPSGYQAPAAEDRSDNTKSRPDGTMVKPPTVFRGKNAIDQFLTKLLDEEKSILDTLRFVKPMFFSMTDEENFKSSTLCSIYENPLNGDAVRDHDHLTGAYRGAAHNRCNSNYDGHFLIQGIDANNLYGWAMSQPLPTHDFSWTDEDVNFMNVPDDSDIGYIFEVDLEYPDNCYPLAPEKIELYHPSFSLSWNTVRNSFYCQKRLQNFVSEQLSELDEKMKSILRNKNMNDSEKVTLYLQILRKYVNFPFPKEINEDMQEPQKEFENSNAEDLKSVIPNEDFKEALGFIKQETSAENIEQEIEKSAPKKYKTIIKKIILFIQKHREEIYWTPDKKLTVDGKIIRNTNVVHWITHRFPLNASLSTQAKTIRFGICPENTLSWIKE
ncbi:uncharacterized protein TNCV_4869441 [Trichonephila clavipes]|nr:uncharacterized protein TNCV_4869441 [Trichonephila clavipes]